MCDGIWWRRGRSNHGFYGYRVLEVPVIYYPRVGMWKISGTLTVGAGWFIPHTFRLVVTMFLVCYGLD
jgi:hypothetical protein